MQDAQLQRQRAKHRRLAEGDRRLQSATDTPRVQFVREELRLLQLFHRGDCRQSAPGKLWTLVLHGVPRASDPNLHGSEEISNQLRSRGV